MDSSTRIIPIDEAIAAGVDLHKAGRLDDAKSIYDQILAQMQHPVALAMRGLIAHQQKDSALAVTLLQQSLNLAPNNPATHGNLGTVLMEQGRHDEAAMYLEKALSLNPHSATAHTNLANLYTVMGRLGDAVLHYERAIALQPQNTGALLNLAAIHGEFGRYAAATSLLRDVTRLDPANAEAYNNLGVIMGRSGMWDEAILFYEKAITLRPDYAEAINNLGALYTDMGSKDQAQASFARAPQAEPGFHQADSNRLFLMHYEEQWSQAQLFAEAKQWAAKHAPSALRLSPAATDKDPQRRLRIGYVSADLREHPVGYFMENILAQHEASGHHDIFCYSDDATADPTAERLRQRHTWRRIYAQPDARAAQIIREDKIDILIDLAGHTANNRLTLFGMKPAPVQITYLGYFDTTGMEAMDYVLCDALMLPPEAEQVFVEKPLRLPGCYLCYTPPAMDIAVKPPPSLQNGFVTFGCFNKVNKISKDTFRVWAEILKATPQSKLFLKSRWLDGAAMAKLVRENFALHRIGEERLILEGQSSHTDYLNSYNRVDIALDPLLYSGGTTTAEALWMGTPVVTQPSGRFASRMSASLLTHAGFPELVTDSYERYIETACALAADASRLGQYKSTLRERFVASPVCDAVRFVTHLETAYRNAWTVYCGSA